MHLFARAVLPLTVVLALCPVWLSAGEEADWRALSATDLTRIYAEQERQRFAGVSKVELIDHVWTEFLTNDAYLETAEVAEVIGLVKPLAQSLNDERKQQLTSMLEARIVANPNVYPEQSIWTVWRLRSVWGDLGVSNEKVYEWTRDWLVSADKWKQEAAHGEINLLLDWAITVRNQAGYDMTDVLDEVYGYIRAKALTDPAWLNMNGTVGMKKMLFRISDRVTLNERGRIRENLIGHVVRDRDRFLGLDTSDMERVREMADLYGASKAEQDGWVLDWVTHSDAWQASDTRQLDMLYKWLGGLGDSADAQAAMGGLARYAARKLANSPELDGSQWYFKSLGVLFKTDEQRQYLAELLVDEDSLPRRNIARALTKASAGTEDVREWLAFIEQAIEGSASQPDRQALWMLVRAEAVTTKEPGILDEVTLDWAVRALGVAGSDEVRLACLEWVVNMFTSAGREAEAVAFIKEHSGQFENEVFREQLSELERMMSASER